VRKRLRDSGLRNTRSLRSIHVVYANWCPHCVPTTVELVKQKAKELGLPCILYDIDDPDASKKGDEVVDKYGDWSVDYLIPQVFLEYDSGEIKHVFTGYSEDMELTRRGIGNLLTSSLLR
jgi:thiol-disulfide isomerase/thioredoxin